jgi:hypothetical protein
VSPWELVCFGFDSHSPPQSSPLYLLNGSLTETRQFFVHRQGIGKGVNLSTPQGPR